MAALADELRRLTQTITRAIGDARHDGDPLTEQLAERIPLFQAIDERLTAIIEGRGPLPLGRVFLCAWKCVMRMGHSTEEHIARMVKLTEVRRKVADVYRPPGRLRTSDPRKA